MEQIVFYSKIGGEWLADTDAKAVAKHLGLPEPREVKRAA